MNACCNAWKMIICGVFLLAVSAGSFTPAATRTVLAQTASPVTPTQTVTPAGPVPALPPAIGTIKIGNLATLGAAPFYLAIEKGYFTAQGLTVEMVRFRSGSEMIPFLSTGDLDLGGGEPGAALLNAVAQGLDVKVVAATASQSPGHGAQPLLVRTDLFTSGEITKPADLKGRKIAVNSRRGMTEYLLSEALGKATLTVDDVDLITMPFADIPAALANKAVEATVPVEPVASRVLDDNSAVVLIPGDKIVDRSQNGVTYFGRRLLEPANREVGVRVLMAFLMAARDLEGPDGRSEQNLAIISKYTQLPPAVIQKVVWFHFDPNGEINTDSVEKIQAYLVGRGYTELSEPLPLSQVIDDSFRMEAVSRLRPFEEWTGLSPAPG